MIIKNFKFNQKIKISDPLRVFFLCGTTFKQYDLNDKRNVLKSYIESKNLNYKVIILEEHFLFGKPRKNFLSYDHIFMNNLKDIEILTGLFSDKIFIFHESISTAAELGMFASNINLLKKTCLITPDNFSVEEEKISAFIRLAFLNYRSPDTNVKNITFFPKIKENIISKTKIEYHTYLPNNKIQKNLGINIDEFINENYTSNFVILFKRNNFNVPFKDKNTITYFFSNSELFIYLDPKTLRILLISIFNSKTFRVDFKKCLNMNDAVKILQSEFKLVINNSISHLEGINFSSYNLEIIIMDYNIPFRKVIGYFLYTLQALKMLQLPVKETSKKISITQKFKEVYESYSDIIYEIKQSKFTKFTGEKNK